MSKHNPAGHCACPWEHNGIHFTLSDNLQLDTAKAQNTAVISHQSSAMTNTTVKYSQNNVHGIGKKNFWAIIRELDMAHKNIYLGFLL